MRLKTEQNSRIIPSQEGCIPTRRFQGLQATQNVHLEGSLNFTANENTASPQKKPSFGEQEKEGGGRRLSTEPLYNTPYKSCRNARTSMAVPSKKSTKTHHVYPRRQFQATERAHKSGVQNHGPRDERAKGCRARTSRNSPKIW